MAGKSGHIPEMHGYFPGMGFGMPPDLRNHIAPPPYETPPASRVGDLELRDDTLQQMKFNGIETSLESLIECGIEDTYKHDWEQMLDVR